eukprot:TRINITY_DN22118_c0_g1_i1.p1 TRINITY_DN22118_c0_g1~~TRINITY_DN22118_c0_g1_i1.p1  ORF type:complete len:103 (+),score=11.30 TRINITY_DN22118_c0_g1_i1:173-481(+)
MRLCALMTTLALAAAAQRPTVGWSSGPTPWLIYGTAWKKGNTTRLALEALQQGFRAFDTCLLYTSDAADEEDSVDLGGRRIIKKKKTNDTHAYNWEAGNALY